MQVHLSAVHGQALGLHIHSRSLTDSPRATSGPASSARGKCPVRAYQFLSFILYFVVRFPCLDTQIPYVTVALYRMPRRSVAQEQGVLSGSVGVRWATAAQSLELLVHMEFSVTGVWLY